MDINLVRRERLFRKFIRERKEHDLMKLAVTFGKLHLEYSADLSKFPEELNLSESYFILDD